MVTPLILMMWSYSLRTRGEIKDYGVKFSTLTEMLLKTIIVYHLTTGV